jgi:DnaK suppressor protein
MEPNELEVARERLLAERARVTGLARNVKSEFDGEGGEDAPELSDYAQHVADAGSDTFEREKDLGLLDDLEAELAEIEAALARIDAGTYGVDEVTGEPIDPERLEVVPAARTNVGDADLLD